MTKKPTRNIQQLKKNLKQVKRKINTVERKGVNNLSNMLIDFSNQRGDHLSKKDATEAVIEIGKDLSEEYQPLLDAFKRLDAMEASLKSAKNKIAKLLSDSRKDYLKSSNDTPGKKPH